MIIKRIPTFLWFETNPHFPLFLNIYIYIYIWRYIRICIYIYIYIWRYIRIGIYRFKFGGKWGVSGVFHPRSGDFLRSGDPQVGTCLFWLGKPRKVVSGKSPLRAPQRYIYMHRCMVVTSSGLYLVPTMGPHIVSSQIKWYLVYYSMVGTSSGKYVVPTSFCVPSGGLY